MSCGTNMCSAVFNYIGKRSPNPFALKVKEVRKETGLIGQELFKEAQKQYNAAKGIHSNRKTKSVSRKGSRKTKSVSRKGSRKTKSVSRKGSRKTKSVSRKGSRKGSRK
jgi:hypothetical protein